MAFRMTERASFGVIVSSRSDDWLRHDNATPEPGRSSSGRAASPFSYPVKTHRISLLRDPGESDFPVSTRCPPSPSDEQRDSLPHEERTKKHSTRPQTRSLFFAPSQHTTMVLPTVEHTLDVRQRLTHQASMNTMSPLALMNAVYIPTRCAQQRSLLRLPRA